MGMFGNDKFNDRHYFRHHEEGNNSNSFHFLEGKVGRLAEDYQGDFNFVLHSGAGNWYIVPYLSIEHLLTDKTLKVSTNKRYWDVKIDAERNVITVTGTDDEIQLRPVP